MGKRAGRTRTVARVVRRAEPTILSETLGAQVLSMIRAGADRFHVRIDGRAGAGQVLIGRVAESLLHCKRPLNLCPMLGCCLEHRLYSSGDSDQLARMTETPTAL